MTNRKVFLQQSALLAAGVLMGSACTNSPSTQNGKQTPKDIGLQLFTLREIIEKDVRGVLQKVAEIGYSDIEPFGFTSQNGFWGFSPTEFKQVLTDLGLKSSSGHYGFDEFLRTDEKTDLMAIIEAAKTIGNEYVTLPWLSDDLHANTDMYKHVADKMNQIGEICKELGLKFAYHNHDFEFEQLEDGGKGYDIFLTECDPKLVDFELDLYWIIRTGNDPIALFDAHPGRFTMWHVKDIDKANSELNTEIGSGSIDFQPIYDAREKSGLKHMFVEQENFSIDAFESIKQSYDFINTQWS
ncbi:sugar phosphate isomerase/epimerase family protein [Albibacterium indicum]|uniref:sugar phosphate isomerase/epimerase family protein n=1 Tax=Albibacterium indicum TaxID=2292082 RepID=UPI000E4DC69C|nr:sugar phosphate isomerase/epimerase [Pedobacter indicus]